MRMSTHIILFITILLIISLSSGVNYECYDPEGANIYIKGTTTLTWINGNVERHPDKCINKQDLKETHCKSRIYKERIESCKYKCFSGKCNPAPGVCKDGKKVGGKGFTSKAVDLEKGTLTYSFNLNKLVEAGKLSSKQKREIVQAFGKEEMSAEQLRFFLTNKNGKRLDRVSILSKFNKKGSTGLDIFQQTQCPCTEFHPDIATSLGLLNCPPSDISNLRTFYEDLIAYYEYLEIFYINLKLNLDILVEALEDQCDACKNDLKKLNEIYGQHNCKNSARWTLDPKVAATHTWDARICETSAEETCKPTDCRGEKTEEIKNALSCPLCVELPCCWGTKCCNKKEDGCGSCEPKYGELFDPAEVTSCTTNNQCASCNFCDKENPCCWPPACALETKKSFSVQINNITVPLCQKKVMEVKDVCVVDGAYQKRFVNTKGEENPCDVKKKVEQVHNYVITFIDIVPDIIGNLKELMRNADEGLSQGSSSEKILEFVQNLESIMDRANAVNVGGAIWNSKTFESNLKRLVRAMKIFKIDIEGNNKHRLYVKKFELSCSGTASFKEINPNNINDATTLDAFAEAFNNHFRQKLYAQYGPDKTGTLKEVSQSVDNIYRDFLKENSIDATEKINELIKDARSSISGIKLKTDLINYLNINKGIFDHQNPEKKLDLTANAVNTIIKAIEKADGRQNEVNVNTLFQDIKATLKDVAPGFNPDWSTISVANFVMSTYHAKLSLHAAQFAELLLLTTTEGLQSHPIVIRDYIFYNDGDGNLKARQITIECGCDKKGECKTSTKEKIWIYDTNYLETYLSKCLDVVRAFDAINENQLFVSAQNCLNYEIYKEWAEREVSELPFQSQEYNCANICKHRYNVSQHYCDFEENICVCKSKFGPVFVESVTCDQNIDEIEIQRYMQCCKKMGAQKVDPCYTVSSETGFCCHSFFSEVPMPEICLYEPVAVVKAVEASWKKNNVSVTISTFGSNATAHIILKNIGNKDASGKGTLSIFLSNADEAENTKVYSSSINIDIKEYSYKEVFFDIPLLFDYNGKELAFEFVFRDNGGHFVETINNKENLKVLTPNTVNIVHTKYKQGNDFVLKTTSGAKITGIAEIINNLYIPVTGNISVFFIDNTGKSYFNSLEQYSEKTIMPGDIIELPTKPFHVRDVLIKNRLKVKVVITDAFGLVLAELTDHVGLPVNPLKIAVDNLSFENLNGFTLNKLYRGQTVITNITLRNPDNFDFISDVHIYIKDSVENIVAESIGFVYLNENETITFSLPAFTADDAIYYLHITSIEGSNLFEVLASQWGESIIILVPKQPPKDFERSVTTDITVGACNVQISCHKCNKGCIIEFIDDCDNIRLDKCFCQSCTIE